MAIWRWGSVNTKGGGERRPREGDATMLHEALGFLGWLAVAATLCTLAAPPVAWSGLGAASVLTLAAVLVERRQRRP